MAGAQMVTAAAAAVGTALCCAMNGRYIRVRAAVAHGRDPPPKPADLDRTRSFRPPDDSHPFRSCLDRPYVQAEIRWALKHNKKIIVIYEKDERKAGFFDFGQAWEKYRGTEWEFILQVDAEPYQRDEAYAQAMVGKILLKAEGLPAVAAARPAMNKPGRWDLFLSHAQATGGDQVQNASLRLRGAGRTVWYDMAMLDRSTAAMEEGVKHCRCFVLFLTGDAPAGRPTDRQALPPAADISTNTSVSGTESFLDDQIPGRVADRKAHYSNRAIVNEALVEWAMAANAEQGLLLLGRPGAGKTTLLTELIEDETSVLRPLVLATHFCAAQSPESLQPRSFVRNVLGQLYFKCSAFRKHVESSEGLRGKVKKLLGSYGGEGVSADPLGNFVDLLAVLKCVFPGNARPYCGHVLVIDSLDEALLVAADGGTKTDTVVHVIKTCKAKDLFPSWMRILATTRDIPAIQNNMKGWRRIDLADAAIAMETLQTIRKYINIRLDDPNSGLRTRVEMAFEDAEWEPDNNEERDLFATGREAFSFHCCKAASVHFEKLAIQSGGNFLWVESALDDIEAGSSKLADVSSLPQGLEDLFAHFFERLFISADSEKYQRVRPIFEAILASGGVGVTQLGLLQCLRLRDPRNSLSEPELMTRLQSVQQFLRRVPGLKLLEPPVPHCEKGHLMITLADDARDSCGICGKVFARYATCSAGCKYNLCKACSGGLVRSSDLERTKTASAERLAFYHLSFAEWLTGTHEYAADVNAGNRSLASLLFASLSSPVADEEFAAAFTDMGCSEQLHAKHLRVARARTKHAAPGTVLDLASHLSRSVTASGDDMEAYGKILSAANVDVERPCRTEAAWVGVRAACVAAGKDDAASLELLLAAGASANVTEADRFGFAPLHWAAKNDCAATLHLLLKRDSVEHNVVTGGGWSALHVAARFGSTSALSTLLQAGLSIEAPAGASKYTPLHLAGRHGQAQTAQLLVHAGAKIEVCDKDGDTPFQVAAWGGHVDVARILAEAGAKVDVCADDGCTPLHLAAIQGHTDVVRWLLSSEVNAEVEVQDKEGYTPLYWAMKENHLETAQVLISGGATLNVDRTR